MYKLLSPSFQLEWMNKHKQVDLMQFSPKPYIVKKTPTNIHKHTHPLLEPRGHQTIQIRLNDDCQCHEVFVALTTTTTTTLGGIVFLLLLTPVRSPRCSSRHTQAHTCTNTKTALLTHLFR